MTFLLFSLLACRRTSESEPVEKVPGDTDTTPEVAGDRPSGDFLLDFSVAAVGGLSLPFQASLSSTLDDDGQEVLSSFELRATDGEDALSDVLASASDLPWEDDGSVEVALGAFVLPGAFSPTNGDVILNVTLDVASSSPDGFCGDVTGMIVTFALNLEGSTFGAVDWDARAEGGPSSCDDSVEEIPRMSTEDCPALTDGENQGFASGGLERSFNVVLPSGYDPAVPAPLIFAFHGYGGSGKNLLDSEIIAVADRLGAILVAPDAADRGGEAAWDVFNDDTTNTDLALVDDLVTCASHTWNVDPDSIHATGMSNGGLFTGLLIEQRSNLLASAAPFSGGLLGPMADDFYPLPVQVLWGGDTDHAYAVDFAAAATDMISTLDGAGSFLIACEHDGGHSYESSFWDFTLPFLVDHPKGVTPEPYAEGLPEAYPDWCAIVEE